ncbi:hypothetical protein K488DRAFT_82308 [Vararia minispora EC-137]|uniref:Uncharacterized protein n=1 Tax=Vararia minispora EC-137 TaxID=1314806 RepID=A0ACB8QWI3_9AGAM|nr:hypothetical protein K488DRAFT_82308 [Vararia minispora EC-137]
MDKLPTEMLVYIIKNLAPEDLRRLRATNKQMKDLASPTAFSVVKVTNTVRSMEGLFYLLNESGICGMIESIEFSESELPAFIESWEECDKDLELFKCVEKSYASIYLATRLERLFFTFDDMYPWLGDDDDYPSQPVLQYAILSALASTTSHPHPSLRSLTIENLLALNNPHWSLMAPLLSGLHSLKIHVLADDTDCSFDSDELHEFYDALSSVVLAACTSLRHLSLSGTRMVGVLPRIDFRMVNCPHLTMLSLKSMILSWDEDGTFCSAEDFIVRHAGTLESLKLIGCGMAMLIGDDAPVRFWSPVWTRFAETLTALTKLEIKFDAPWDPPEDGTDGEVRYFLEDSKYGFIQHGDVEGKEDDIPAFEALKAVVDSRRENKRGLSSA